MSLIYFSLLWLFLFIGYGLCGADEVKGFEGFRGEVLVEGRVLIATVVFEITIMLQGVPIIDFRQAQLVNQPQYFVITLFSNKIMATRTVPVGTSEALMFTIEGQPDCVYTLTIAVVDKASTSTTQSTELTSVTPYCHYDVECIKDFSGEVAIEGEVSIASTVFQIVFLENGVPITEFRRAELLIEPQYFTITLNTNEIMATRTVPTGTSEDLLFTVEGDPECLFIITVVVISRPTITPDTVTSSAQSTDHVTPKSTTTLRSDQMISSVSSRPPFSNTATTATGKTVGSKSQSNILSTASQTILPETPAIFSQSDYPMPHTTSAVTEYNSTRHASTTPASTTAFVESASKWRGVSVNTNSTAVTTMELHTHHLLSQLLGLLSTLVYMYIVSA